MSEFDMPRYRLPLSRQMPLRHEHEEEWVRLQRAQNTQSDEERTRLENEVFAERMRLAKNGQTDDVVSGT
jgi:hypothetical protein